MSAFNRNPALSKAHKAFAAPSDFQLHASHASNLHSTEQNSKDVRLQDAYSQPTNSQNQTYLIQPQLFGLCRIQDLYREQESISTQASMLPTLSMLRERTLSDISWRQARKMGYPWESPSLRPQKSDDNPPPITLPSPVRNKPQPPPRLPDEDEFTLDNLSWNYAQTPQPNSAPEQLNYKDSPLRMASETEEQILFFESQELEDDEDHHHSGDCQDFTPSLGGMFQNSYSSSTSSSAPSPNSILGFMEMRLHQNNSQSGDDTDYA